MTDRIPGAPGQYKLTVTAEEAQKLLAGGTVTITLTRDDQPQVVGTPYNKTAVLPDDLAAAICPEYADPTPADAFRSLLPKRGGLMTGNIDMGGNKIQNLATPSNDSDAVTKKYVDAVASRTVVFTNSNPTAGFSGRTVNIQNMSEYSEFFAVCQASAGSEYSGHYITGLIDAKPGTYYVGFVSPVESTALSRPFEVTNSGIVIGNGNVGTSSNSDVLIPVRIYGIRHGKKV